MSASSGSDEINFTDLAKKVQEAIFEMLYMSGGVIELDQMVQALESENFLVDQVQVYWTVHLCPSWLEQRD